MVDYVTREELLLYDAKQKESGVSIRQICPLTELNYRPHHDIFVHKIRVARSTPELNGHTNGAYIRAL